MNKKIIDLVEKEFLKKEIPSFKVGDTVAVYQKIVEGDKSRTQLFEGIVVGRRGNGINETFSVLYDVRGDQVEKVFPIHSPFVEKIKVVQDFFAVMRSFRNLAQFFYFAIAFFLVVKLLSVQIFFEFSENGFIHAAELFFLVI